MPSYLVDTNIWSEALKKNPNPRVVEWLRMHEASLYVSTITIGELKYGISRLADGKRKTAFQKWLSAFTDRMKGRVVSYNTSVAIVWGQMQAKCEAAGIRLTSLDSLLEATAIRYSLTLVTRNEKDFRHTHAKVENPFNP